MTIEEKQAFDVISKSSNLKFLVTILEVAAYKSGIDTVSETARKESKSPNGIRTSNQYRKIKIGKQTMVVIGLEDSKLPF